MKGARIVGLAVGLTLAASGCTTTVRRHPELNTRLPRIHHVAVMPPKVSLTLITFKGDNQRLYEDEERATRELVPVLTSVLTGKGFEVTSVDLTAVTADGTPDGGASDSQFAAATLLDRFGAVSDEIFKQPAVLKSQAAKLDRTLGTQVNRFADQTGADALILIKVQGFRKSTGEQVKDLVVDVLLGAATGVYYNTPASGLSLQAALIDGGTGDLLWANTAGREGGALTGKDLAGVAEALWKDFPPR